MRGKVRKFAVTMIVTSPLKEDTERTITKDVRAALPERGLHGKKISVKEIHDKTRRNKSCH